MTFQRKARRFFAGLETLIQTESCLLPSGETVGKLLKMVSLVPAKRYGSTHRESNEPPCYAYRK